jgi:AcrR family transcriptional regulator
MTFQAVRRGRPKVSTREAIEELSFELLLRDGYERTTVQTITAAAGVSRTTFFRYFGSKGGIVWGEFDRAIDRLRAALDAAPADPIMSAVVDAVAESTRLSRGAAPDSWLDRFRVLDEDPALTGETAEHWRIWASVITDYVERRCALPAGSVVGSAVGGAMQAAYVAMLRQWSSATDEVEISSLRSALEPIGVTLQRLLNETD